MSGLGLGLIYADLLRMEKDMEEKKEITLPPLPESAATPWHPFKYTAEQMQNYARAAVAAALEAPSAAPVDAQPVRNDTLEEAIAMLRRMELSVALADVNGWREATAVVVGLQTNDA